MKHHKYNYNNKKNKIKLIILILIIIFLYSQLNFKIMPNSKFDFLISREIEFNNKFYFGNTDKIDYIKMSNVPMTFYSRNDGYTPSNTTRSGRFVYEGAIAISRPMLKYVNFGDLIYVDYTKRWYKVEDTMHEKYISPRIDIYTHDLKLANSGNRKTDIIILKQPR